MTGDSAMPNEGAKGRARLRAEWRAESTWRRHEILGRIQSIEAGLKDANKLVQRVTKVLDSVLASQAKIVEVIEAEEKPTGELPPPKGRP